MTTEIENNPVRITNPPLKLYGIIGGFFKEYGIINAVDTLIPKTRDHYLTNGECLLALALVNFTFIRRALYKVEDIMEEVPIPMLFGRDISHEYFNDDVLGKFLERIFDYGTSEFFVRMVENIRLQNPTLIETNRFHADTTNFSVFGEYKNSENDSQFKIVRGHAKDSRDHLKLFSLFLLSDLNGIPVFMKEFSGNTNDSKVINDNINEAIKQLKNTLDRETHHYISDASFYNQKNISSAGFRWISRVPERIKIAEDYKNSDVVFTPIKNDDRYSYHQMQSNYAGVDQLWILIHSNEMQKKKEKTFDKAINKALASANVALRKICKQPYACEEDANRAAEKWIKQFPNFQFRDQEVITKEVTAKAKPGRPKKDEVRPVNYYIKAELTINEEVVNKKRQVLGRFILATNDRILKAEDILRYYKEQSAVEKDFRFLKGDEFHISEVLLKNHHRIQGLSCVMALMLLFYSLIELKMRKGLKENNIILKNAAGKPILKPTFLDQSEKFMDACGNIIFYPNNKSIKIDFRSSLNYDRLVILRSLGPLYLQLYTFHETNVSDINKRWAYNFMERYNYNKDP